MSAAVAFGPTADPGSYVPWSGSERALGELTRWALGSAAPVCVLSGPPGMGKTLLLKLLAARTQLPSLFLAYPECDRAAIRELVMQGLDSDAPDSTEESLRAALRAAKNPVLLLIDEGELLPLDTVQSLREVATSGEGSLRVVIAVTSDARRGELASLLGDAAQQVRIEGSMSRVEVAAHVRVQLARAEVDPRIGARFDRETLARLHARSEGVPAALQSLAAALLFKAERASGEVRVPRLRTAEEHAADTPESAAAAMATARPSAAPSRFRRGRAAVFAFGAALGVAAGFALAGRAPRLLAGRETSPVAAVTREAIDSPPPVSAAPTVTRMQEPATPQALPPPPPPEARDLSAPATPAVAVSFNSEPWAYIEVDGHLIGVTPIAEHPIPPGRHRIIASLVDGRVFEREVEVDGKRGRRIVFP